MQKITVKKKTENFVILDKTALNDSELSWKAKGLHSYLLALPDDWNLFIGDLENRSTDGRDSTRGAINELLEHGYIERVMKKEKGKFMGYDYSIFEKPQTDKPLRENRSGETVNGKTADGKPHTNKVLNIVNNKEINIDIKEGEETPTPQIENDFVVFEVVEEKAEIENKANSLPLEEKKEKEKKVAAKKEKETKPDNKKDLLDVYADEESFSIAWGLRFGAKYPNIDASKAYTKLLQYSLNKGVKYADWVLTAKVWYEKEETAAKRSTWEVTEKSQTVQSKMQAAENRLYRKHAGPL